MKLLKLLFWIIAVYNFAEGHRNHILWPEIKAHILGAPLMIGAESMTAICENKVEGFCSYESKIPSYITFVGRSLTKFFRENVSLTKNFFESEPAEEVVERLYEIFRYYRDIDNTIKLTVEEKLAILKRFLEELKKPVLSDAVYNAMKKRATCETKEKEVWDLVDGLSESNRNSFIYLINILQYAMNKSKRTDKKGKEYFSISADFLAKQLEFYHKKKESSELEEPNENGEGCKIPLEKSYYECLAHLIRTYNPINRSTSTKYEYGEPRKPNPILANQKGSENRQPKKRQR